MIEDTANTNSHDVWESGSAPDVDHDSSNPYRNLFMDILRVTETVIDKFLGDKGNETSSRASHDVYRAIWGSVDMIWRVSFSACSFFLKVNENELANLYTIATILGGAATRRQ